MKYNNDYNEIQPLSINNDCYVAIHNFIVDSIEYIEKRFEHKKVPVFLEEFQKLISVNLKPKFSDNVVNCKLTKNYKSIDVCFQILLMKNSEIIFLIKILNQLQLKFLMIF